MSDAPRFGVLVLPNQSWSNILAQAQQVERLGFDLFTMADHFVDWSDISRPWLEGWSILTAVAMATSRIRLATYVTQIPLRHPAIGPAGIDRGPHLKRTIGDRPWHRHCHRPQL